MADQETLLERLIPGDLEHQIPAAVEKVLPGGFKNRIVQIGLGLLLAFGFKFVVKRWVEARERRQRALAPPPPALASRASGRQSAREAPVPPPRPAFTGGAAGIHALLAQPQVNLSGPVDQIMYANFRNQIAAANGPEPLVIAISTMGGDPEVARLMADELRLLGETGGRDALFLGRVSVYSAGTILMAAFPANKRYLTRGTRLMIHERSLSISQWGPIRTLAATLRSTLDEIEHFVKIDDEVFRALVQGTKVDIDEMRRRAPDNWYIDAEEARDLGLVLDVI